ncbi:nitroreductase family protein [Chloroflexota bacterium]
MHLLQKPVSKIITERFSCRTFKDEPIPDGKLDDLQNFISKNPFGPFGENHRFKLIAVGQSEGDILKGLGTYGFIKGATAYLIGASQPSGMYLEDFGYLMEKYILAATAYGLGTCWLGGSFTRSSFSRKISLQSDEELPAVIALGHIKDPEKARNGFIRRQAGSHERRGWKTMFHLGSFGQPLDRKSAGNYDLALEMVRLGPSASNKQPWQIVKDGSDWHFFLRRTVGYRDGSLSKRLSTSDLQRVDLGIAMCHFELVSQELGLKGCWLKTDHMINIPNNQVEYTATWRDAND